MGSADLHERASALLAQHQFEGAWECIATLSEIEPPCWKQKALGARVLLEWGKADGDDQRLVDAAETFVDAIALLKADHTVHAEAAQTEMVELENDRGVALYELQNLEEARSAFERTLQWNHQHGRALSNMGLIDWAEGRERIALSNFDKAIASGENTTHAHNNRGALLVELGEVQRALADFHTALAINPSYETARRNRDQALAALAEPVPMQPVSELTSRCDQPT